MLFGKDVPWRRLESMSFGVYSAEELRWETPRLVRLHTSLRSHVCNGCELGQSAWSKPKIRYAFTKLSQAKIQVLQHVGIPRTHFVFFGFQYGFCFMQTKKIFSNVGLILSTLLFTCESYVSVYNSYCITILFKQCIVRIIILYMFNLILFIDLIIECNCEDSMYWSWSWLIQETECEGHH